MRIEFHDVWLAYAGRTVLHPFSLGLDERRIGVIGLNGSGKTSFARLINGLARPSGGTVHLDGLDRVNDARALAGRVGLVFQHPQNQIILPVVADDIAFGLKNRGLAPAGIEAAVDAVLARLGMRHLAGRRAHELSGGELQLAALAAVLVTGPDLLILDEPTNQLDLKNRAMVENTVAGLPEQTIVISHDLALIENFDRVLLFHDGRIAADGPPAQAISRYHALALS